MPRIDWGRLQTILICLIALLVLLVALGYALAQVSHALLLFVLAAVLALGLAPLVDWGERLRLPRWVAVVATFLLFAVAIVGGALLLITPLVDQAVALSNAVPGYVASINDSVQQLSQAQAGTPFAGALDALQAQGLTAVASWSGVLVGSLVGLLTGFGGGMADLVLVLIIAIYMLLEGRRILESVHDRLPARYRGACLFITDTLAHVVGGYVRGQLVLALGLGVVVTIGLHLLGVPYALLLGLLAAVLGLVPMFGSALAGVPAVLVALTQPFPTPLWVLIFFVIAVNVRDQVLAPRIAGQAVGLHPLATIFALLAGVQLGGILGALFALPVAGFIWAMIVAVGRFLQPAAEPAPAVPDRPSAEISPAEQPSR
jgi:predicted PurR-regulated permease PerM